MKLFGAILRELEGQILFRVSPGRGDAPLLGFPADAEFWVKRAQCLRIRYAPLRGELDEIELSAELASLKAQSLVCVQHSMGGC